MLQNAHVKRPLASWVCYIVKLHAQSHTKQNDIRKKMTIIKRE